MYKRPAVFQMNIATILTKQTGEKGNRVSGRGAGLSSLLLRLIFLVVGEEGGGKGFPLP